MAGKRVFRAGGTRFRGRGLPFFALPAFVTLLAAGFFLFVVLGAVVLAAAGILGLGASLLGRFFRAAKTPKPETSPGDAIALGEEDYEIRDVRSGPSGGG